MCDELENLQKISILAKFDFDPTTWVVWANTRFATVRSLTLSFFFGFLATRSGRRRAARLILAIHVIVYNVFLCNDVLLVKDG